MDYALLNSATDLVLVPFHSLIVLKISFKINAARSKLGFGLIGSCLHSAMWFASVKMFSL